MFSGYQILDIVKTNNSLCVCFYLVESHESKHMEK